MLSAIPYGYRWAGFIAVCYIVVQYIILELFIDYAVRNDPVQRCHRNCPDLSFSDVLPEVQKEYLYMLETREEGAFAVLSLRNWNSTAPTWQVETSGSRTWDVIQAVVPKQTCRAILANLNLADILIAHCPWDADAKERSVYFQSFSDLRRIFPVHCFIPSYEEFWSQAEMGYSCRTDVAEGVTARSGVLFPGLD
eukprot:GFYU01015652.1.p1 GENE.GFYU01015652.1~~GFYU01015652.1.p1  ORF type:complete len:195 (+),score=8.45 GFYU01015652.1:179-763(+)